MSSRHPASSHSRLLIIAVISAVVVAVVLIGWPMVARALQRAERSEALKNARAIKSALDGFASDFHGRYPNDETADRVSSEDLGHTSSNDYFRQLFMTLETGSEKIFWVKHSPVASDAPPDDKTRQDSKPQPNLILQPGDCHWAYVRELTNTHPGQLPIILDPFLPGTDQFDPNLWRGRAIVIRLDGSADAHDLDHAHHLPPESGEAFFAPAASRWSWCTGDPIELLAQPERP